MKQRFQELLRTLSLALIILSINQAIVAAEESQWLLSADSPPSVASSATDLNSSRLPESKSDSIRTVASSLAIVLGGFLLLTALFRRHSRRPDTSRLIETLGAVQVTPKVKLHLVRFGSRLLVLHVSPKSVERVAEISDPVEVERLLGEGSVDAAVHPQVDDLLAAVEGTSLTSIQGVV